MNNSHLIKEVSTTVLVLTSNRTEHTQLVRQLLTPYNLVPSEYYPIFNAIHLRLMEPPLYTTEYQLNHHTTYTRAPST